jgi:predicted nucleotidyltransferase component of viral defense system
VSHQPTRADLGGQRYLALRRLAQQTQRATAELLQLYALEGFVVRLSTSQHRERLVLKGGFLLASFDVRRPTRDVDLLALRLDNDVEVVRELIAAIAAFPVDDGLVFEPEVTASTIREGEAYAGVRVTLRATLATARITFHVDVNVGDPLWPAAETATLPRLLDAEPLRVTAYPLTLVLAEKAITAAQRGVANTRWRDFADLFLLARQHEVDGTTLQQALRVVAEHRRAPLVPLADVLGGFEVIAQPKWRAWVRSVEFVGRLPDDVGDALGVIYPFVDPALQQRVEGLTWAPARTTWAPPTPPAAPSHDPTAMPDAP